MFVCLILRLKVFYSTQLLLLTSSSQASIASSLLLLLLPASMQPAHQTECFSVELSYNITAYLWWRYG